MHPDKPVYPSLVDVEKDGLKPQGKPWECEVTRIANIIMINTTGINERESKGKTYHFDRS